LALKQALAAGDAVVATARDPSTITARLGSHERLLATRLDVTNEAERIRQQAQRSRNSVASMCS
jgi:hypothetical protein